MSDRLPDVLWIAEAHLWDQPSVHRQIPMIPLSALEAYVEKANDNGIGFINPNKLLAHFKQAAGQEES